MQNKMGETKSLVYKTKMADDSVRPTKRVLDAGVSAAFSSTFPWPVSQDRLDSGFFCSQIESTPAQAPVTQAVDHLLESQ
jgi:hypothetical protein